MNVFHGISKEERFMNDVSLLETHETTVLCYITETITKQTQVKKSKENKIVKKLKNKFNKKAKKEELECVNRPKNNRLMCTKIRNAFEKILTKQMMRSNRNCC